MKPYTLEQAEADLCATLAAGANAEEINRLGAIIDSLDITPQAATLHQAALWYAQNGFHVFQLRAGSKFPLAKCSTCKNTDCPGPYYCEHDQCHGCTDATLDLDLVDAWWTRRPDANIGLATGHRFDCIDIDGAEGHASRNAHWDDLFADIDRDAFAKVSTPRPGGMHIYVPATGDGNGTKIVPGVDYRGKGGYVVAPPSTTREDQERKVYAGSYTFLGPVRLEKLADAA